MIKTIKNKLCQIIQCTKKSHLLHIWFILCFPCFIITALEIFLSLLISPWTDKEISINTTLENFFLPSLLLLLLAILLSVIAAMIQYINTKSIFITNHFLLHNKSYNVFYTLSFIGILIFWGLALFL